MSITLLEQTERKVDFAHFEHDTNLVITKHGHSSVFCFIDHFLLAFLAFVRT